MSETLLDLYVERKAFAQTTVLRQVSLQLHAGETVSLLGPSGCGKSTLLRIVAGLEKDFEGELKHTTSPIAFVFQEPRLMPWLMVEQNIGFSEDEGYDRAWVTQLIEEVGLSGFAQALPKQLSGGMAQRVAIARGLYSKPRVLLLDEPFSAVDAFTRMKLQDLLLQLARRHGIALLLVTHDVDEALYLSDRVLVMDNRPSRIRQALAVDLPHPRDRRDSQLADLKALSLTELHRAHVI
ncbi:ABC-type nitrate/sulfonate/bicarbonate transport system, ATPase component [Pseudomonas asplenii]|uniref:ABC-type nitrate/sulfonate/bicarbonate transport system, ATPase component n=1 Tax=Pseudomonas asplenii TaxID=53407 RepID=A0A0N0VK99_9PSED|nr:ABC transporter ATP-binding protein [Pseudomonas fuscovaginae]KPA91308.1 ABC-type nitrate/sulfonate/bicarbonate transport system, ATPase component [Pseudomonas fuscovaginae]